MIRASTEYSVGTLSIQPIQDTIQSHTIPTGLDTVQMLRTGQEHPRIRPMDLLFLPLAYAAGKGEPVDPSCC